LCSNLVENNFSWSIGYSNRGNWGITLFILNLNNI
jgi:hypothetical protein